MAHTEDHKTRHETGGDDELLASTLNNDSVVSGASIKDALETLNDSIVSESIWNHAAGAISPQEATDTTLDFSGIGANDFTLKVPTGQAFSIVNSTSTVLMDVSDGQLDLSGAAGSATLKVKAGDYGFLVNDGTNDIFGFTMSGDQHMISFSNMGKINYDESDDQFKMVSNMSGPIIAVKPSEFSMLGGLGVLTDGKFDMSGMGSESIVQFKIYSQATMPALTADGEMAIWEDTDDNKLYLVSYNNSATKAVELT